MTHKCPMFRTGVHACGTGKYLIVPIN